MQPRKRVRSRDPGLYFVLFIQPEQMASEHSCLASSVHDGIQDVSFLPAVDTWRALASLAHAVMHGCICVLTIMWGVWWMEVEGREISRGAYGWYKNQQQPRGGRVWGADPVTPQSPPSFFHTLLFPFPSTSLTLLFICPLSTRLCYPSVSSSTAPLVPSFPSLALQEWIQVMCVFELLLWLVIISVSAKHLRYFLG